LWLQEAMPYVLIFYDAQLEVAYWLYIQATLSGLNLSQLGNTHTVYLEKQNILDVASVRLFATYKRQIFQQLQERIRYEK
jgi:hypothetical protein